MNWIDIYQIGQVHTINSNKLINLNSVWIKTKEIELISAISMENGDINLPTRTLIFFSIPILERNQVLFLTVNGSFLEIREPDVRKHCTDNATECNRENRDENHADRVETLVTKEKV